jgi:hypothetical protein
MPRYYFHIRTKDALIGDPDGSDLADLDAARAEAQQSARNLLAALLARGEVLDGQVFEICDADGRVIESIPFRSVLRLSDP